MKVKVNETEPITKYKIEDAETVEFNSMNEFYDYLCDTPFNNSFRWIRHSSVESSKVFTGTDTFDEAVYLMKTGWSDMSKKLTQVLKAEETQMHPVTKQKTTYGVAGYQAIVPLYLNNVPTNMASKKNVPIKQKVITLTKCIQYSCDVTTEEIIEESLKVFRIIKKLEAQGYRCILNVAEYIEKNGDAYCFKVRVKNSTEKLNISKLAFPLVHPSMLRRLMFRMLEVHPGVPEQFTSGYGHPMNDMKAVKTAFVPEKGEYILPNIIRTNVDNIKSIEDLENL